MNTKDLIRAELEKLSKEDLINIIAEVANAFVVASVNSRIANANCIQQCVRNIHTDTQKVIGDMCQQIDVNLSSYEIPQNHSHLCTTASR